VRRNKNSRNKNSHQLQADPSLAIDEIAVKALQVGMNLRNLNLILVWLEPHVQSALGMKRYVEKALQVEKLKENIVVSELETERLLYMLVLM
jgi:hypothetical protein